MKTTFFLLNLSLNGIKNIENEIKIDFYKKTIGKSFSSKGYNVKAIYGENGSGKTAIVSAVDLLRKLLTEEDYLGDSTNQKYLDEIVNKKNGVFCCSCEFLLLLRGSIQIFKYSIELSKADSDKFQIKRESLLMRARTSSTYKTVFRCENGDIIQISCSPESEEIIRKKSANVLGLRTFVTNTFTIRKSIDDKDFMYNMVGALMFGLSVHAYLDSNDQHDLYFISKTIKELHDEENEPVKAFYSVLKNIDKLAGVSEKIVLKRAYKDYEKKVKRLERFLKLFKPDLVEISIDRKENKDYFECSLIMKYDKYSVDKEFESTGIKRLIDLFDYLSYAADGQIVFIDEMDANINDIYLCKIAEYFVNYAEGQLCFTTHNTSPMSVLRGNKKSIDFLSNDSRIIPWRSNGNYSPERLYRAGMIEYLPFNVDSTDFVGILGGGDN